MWLYFVWSFRSVFFWCLLFAGFFGFGCRFSDRVSFSCLSMFFGLGLCFFECFSFVCESESLSSLEVSGLGFI